MSFISTRFSKYELQNGKIKADEVYNNLDSINDEGPFESMCVNYSENLVATYGNSWLKVHSIDRLFGSKLIWSYKLQADTLLQMEFNPHTRQSCDALSFLTKNKLVSVYFPYISYSRSHKLDANNKTDQNVNNQSTDNESEIFLPIIDEVMLNCGGIPPNIIKFCHGSQSSPLGPVTVFLANTDSDIYRIPFCPPEITISNTIRRSFLKYCDTLDLKFSLAVEVDTFSTFKRLSTLSPFLDSEYLQIIPYPEKLYDSELLDMKCIFQGTDNQDWKTDVLVAVGSTFINFLMLPSPESTSLTLIMALDLGITQEKSSISMVSDTYLFVNSLDLLKTIVIDIRNLNFGAFMQNGRRFGEVTYETLYLSNVSINHFCGEISACNVSTQEVRKFTLNDAAEIPIATLSLENLDSELKERMENQDTYASYMKEPTASEAKHTEQVIPETTLINSDLEMNDRVLTVPKSPPNSVQFLLDMSELLKSMQQWYVDLYTKAKLLESVKESHSDVIDSQASSVEVLKEQVDRAFDFKSLETKLADIYSKQEQLVKRVDTVRKLVSEAQVNKNLPLSRDEKVWIDSINKLPHKIEVIENELGLIDSKNEREGRDGANEQKQGTQSLSSTQVQYIWQRLNSQQKILDLVKSSMAEAN